MRRKFYTICGKDCVEGSHEIWVYYISLRLIVGRTRKQTVATTSIAVNLWFTLDGYGFYSRPWPIQTCSCRNGIHTSIKHHREFNIHSSRLCHFSSVLLHRHRTIWPYSSSAYMRKKTRKASKHYRQWNSQIIIGRRIVDLSPLNSLQGFSGCRPSLTCCGWSGTSKMVSWNSWLSSSSCSRCALLTIYPGPVSS